MDRANILDRVEHVKAAAPLFPGRRSQQEVSQVENVLCEDEPPAPRRHNFESNTFVCVIVMEGFAK